MIQDYLKNLAKTAKAGDATEASYYPDLKSFLYEFLTKKGFDPSVTVQPKRQIYGIPDFTVRKGKELIGYIEAKDPKYEDLSNLPERDQEQIKKYLDKLPNVILTNYFDFWLFREGACVKKVKIAFPRVTTQLKMPAPAQNEDKLVELLDLFFAYYIPESRSPKALAKELAHRAHLLVQTIVEELANETETEIDRIYNAFKEYLMRDLTPHGFADIYAQTLAYGLFTARLNYPGRDFDRKKAGEYIPKSVKILKDTFNLISSDAIPESLESYVDDITTILAHSNIEEIKSQLKDHTGDSDPLIHFYETFLAEYDPAKRKSLGVYYTPLPVVSYIVRSVNSLLKEKFGIGNGLAGDAVTLLDPAAGTLTFPSESIKEAVREHHRYSDSVSPLKSYFLNHFFAFEIQMAAYIIGHLRMSLLFEELGIPLSEQDRFPLFLTNSLDFGQTQQGNLPGIIADLAKEAEYAKVIKEKDILVIFGNPPYTSEKKVEGQLPVWIKEKLLDYSQGLGVEDEKKKGVLQDDYIRFIRFAHWKIDQYGKGIFAFITNNSYLDGIIHRSMRKQLLDSFDEVYILNLHGNSRVHEKTTDGGKDENVFDIQQGVAVSIFVKTGVDQKNKQLFYKDLYGRREEDKYSYLRSHLVSDGDLKPIEPQPNDFYFLPKDYSLKVKYDSWLSLDDIFPSNSNGIETGKDELTIFETKTELKALLFALLSSETDENLRLIYGIKDGANWNLTEIRKHLKGEGFREEKIIKILYRPFDYRWTYFDSVFLARSRKPFMDTMASGNIAILAKRQVKTDKYSQIFVSDTIGEAVVLESAYAKAQYFPIFTRLEILGDSPANLSPILWAKVRNNLPSLAGNINPLDIFYYIYAVLYSSVYRGKYFDFLRSGFPRIPFTKDTDIFFKFSSLGKNLTDLHLLKSNELNDSVVRLVGEGSNRVEKREWREDKIWVNSSQYFAPVSKQVWDYYIGGYQTADKWLKDRQNRPNPVLNQEETKTYCQIIAVIMQTITIQKEIDRLYPKVEESL